MAPSRTRDSTKNAEASSSSSAKAKSKRNYQRKAPEPEPNGAPGVQKIKAALRQTRRLLAKDKVAADVRVETERRQRALEAELQQAEVAKKERAFAIRYHKIKFFERQKITRKLNQAKKSLKAASSDSDKKKHSSELYVLRVDLNYILHYPKTKKYISLFPPEVRAGDEPSEASLAETTKTNADREEVKKWIREQMENGDLPSEPEVELSQHGSGKARAQKWPQGEVPSAPIAGSKPTDDAQDDEFFGEDDDESS